MTGNEHGRSRSCELRPSARILAQRATPMVPSRVNHAFQHHASIRRRCFRTHNTSPHAHKSIPQSPKSPRHKSPHTSPTNPDIDSSSATGSELRLAAVRYTPNTSHSTRRITFTPDNLKNVSHVFLRIDAIKPPPQPRYEGPHAVLERREKKFKAQQYNSATWIPIDRLKPAFIAREDPEADHTYSACAIEVPHKKQVSFFLNEGE